MVWVIFFAIIIGMIIYLAYWIIATPIKVTANAISEAQYQGRQKNAIHSINPKKGRIKIHFYSQNKLSIEGYDNKGKLISSEWKEDFQVARKFGRELEHAKWRKSFISKLKRSHENQWEAILNKSWSAIRALEERDRVIGTIISEPQTDVIAQFADQALVSLYYKSAHDNNQRLCDEIVEELEQATKDYENAEDEDERISISTAIKTHKIRLDKQKKVEKTLRLVDNEFKSLEATLELVIEGIRAEISSHHLSVNPRLSSYDSTLLELKLPILDQIWQSTIESS
ncbi:hypothetical protein [Roseofilum capinflatum]|uniref:Uncharacterized protein n=1 Tax=Roseofilum capinflatum BLCC-M114 TaxID=3022440 RepID=A0ABT7B6D5_9CYAN|nr:hypothetical protein [Roseofilum capinflatum]MDJ1174736.1 hypothetical protein [Roseofilum capinflatum BLCC-M114]